MRIVIRELGYAQRVIKIGVDNKCIEVRFFWVRDLIDDCETALIYFPSEELVADEMITKETTGAKFMNLRGMLLCLMDDDALDGQGSITTIMKSDGLLE